MRRVFLDMARGLRCCATPLSITCKPVLTRAFVRTFSLRGSALNSNSPADNHESVKHPRKKSRKRSRTIFSGIQPTGVPHLGNYLGALRQWKQFQDQKTSVTDSTNDRLIFSIVDLHALTNPQDPAQLLRNRQETLASLLAIGLDPKHSDIFYQSDVPGHSQLMWYLSNIASAGYLSRMTQWKSKLGVSEEAHLGDQEAREKLRLGLFSYPVLQAADILLYRTDLVPVGEDQRQHVEFARNLARSFNAQYRVYNNSQDFFVEPELLISPAKRIMSLRNPTIKMSKSDLDPNSRILITDNEETIHNKIRSALTDSTKGISYDPTTRPGVSNLVEILKHVDNNEATCEAIAQDNADQSMRAFKEHVAQRVVVCLHGVRDRFLELNTPGNQKRQHALMESRRRITSIAGTTIKQIERLMGLRSQAWAVEVAERSELQNRISVMQEQEKLEAESETEPDVTPQIKQGVDVPIAS